MSKHTPGPWIAEQRETRSAVLTARGLCPISDCPQWASRDDRPKAAESFANALLISAAPDLLEALEAARALWGDYLPAGNSNAMKAMRLVDAAIAKAKGEA